MIHVDDSSNDLRECGCSEPEHPGYEDIEVSKRAGVTTSSKSLMGHSKNFETPSLNSIVVPAASMSVCSCLRWVSKSLSVWTKEMFGCFSEVAGSLAPIGCNFEDRLMSSSSLTTSSMAPALANSLDLMTTPSFR